MTPSDLPIGDAAPRRSRSGPAPGTRRLRLTLAYDGLPWKGWQTMPGGQTVQGALAGALLKVCGQAVGTQGSGRTDAGVHAIAQVAHADVPETARLQPNEWISALNACLPPSIRITAATDASPGFHARFDARGKTYRYRIWRQPVMSPFEVGRAWHVHGPLHLNLLHEAAHLLLGTHDFTRLSAFRGVASTRVAAAPGAARRTLTRVQPRLSGSEGELLEIEFDGDGFLYKMVRLIVGSLMQVARGRESLEWFAGLLNEPDATPKSHHAAPADGLYLVKVWYDDEGPLSPDSPSKKLSF